MSAHRHFVIGHPEAKREIAVRPWRRRQHEAALVAIGARHLPHFSVRHAGRVNDDRRRIAAVRTRGKHADKSNPLLWTAHHPSLSVRAVPSRHAKFTPDK